MSQLPIVEGSLVSTPASTVKLDSSALRQAALAPGRLAAAVGQDVGGLFQDVSQKIQQNQNARQIFQADLAMRKTYDEFQSNLAKMPDEKQWLPAWQQKASGLRDQTLDNIGNNPLVKRTLSQKFDVWEASTTAATRTSALLKGRQESYADMIADSMYAASRGQLDDANKIVDSGVENYAATPQQANRLKKKFVPIAEQAQLTTAGESDPYRARQDLQAGKWTSLTPEVREAKIKDMTRLVNRNMSQQYQDIRENQAAGHRYSKDDLLTLSKQHLIEPSSIDTILKAQAGTVKQEDVEANTSKVHDMILAIPNNSSQDDRLSAVTKIHGSPEYQSLPEAVKKDFDGALKNKTAEKAETDNPVATEELRRMKVDFDTGTSFVGVKGGTRGIAEMTEDSFTKQFGAGARRQDVIDQKRAEYAKVQQTFIDWSHTEKGQQATPEEAAAERKRLEQPMVDEQVKGALGLPSTSTDKLIFNKGDKRKQGGIIYQFDGKDWNEVK